MAAPTKTDDKKSTGAGIKVLRIGIVQNGKIIDERELKRRDTVSVGNSQKSTFQVSSEAISRTTWGGGPVRPTVQLVTSCQGTPWITAKSGARGFSRTLRV